MSESKARSIKLQCPSVSKTVVEMVVCDGDRVDLGSIARAFGLDPQTVKLNRHFLSRGLDHVACSVTWKSLLSCFSAKRLSGAIVVDGKLSRVGTKRPSSAEDSLGAFPRSLMEETEMIKKKKTKITEGHSGENGPTVNKSYGYKRKQLIEDLSLLKRLKISETCTDVVPLTV